MSLLAIFNINNNKLPNSTQISLEKNYKSLETNMVNTTPMNNNNENIIKSEESSSIIQVYYNNLV